MSAIDQNSKVWKRHSLCSAYQFMEAIGSGSYAVVWAGVSAKDGERVAIKKNLGVLGHSGIAKRVLREIRLLRLLDCDNIIKIRDVRRSRSSDGIYVVTELMDADLSVVLESNRRGLLSCQVKFFMYQILRGLKYLHGSNIIHRDLKPSNILVNKNCDLKICDLGMARVDFSSLSSPKNQGRDGNQWQCPLMTGEVAARWYRAPEIMMKVGAYTTAMDMWAAGCVLAEMLLGRPLFPMVNEKEQMSAILKVTGTRVDEIIDQVRDDEMYDFLIALPHQEQTPLSSLLPMATATELDLLEQMIVVDPRRRISAAAALRHPYFSELHRPEDEPAGPAISPDLFRFDLDSDYPSEGVVAGILEEMEMYDHPPSPSSTPPRVTPALPTRHRTASINVLIAPPAHGGKDCPPPANLSSLFGGPAPAPAPATATAAAPPAPAAAAPVVTPTRASIASFDDSVLAQPQLLRSSARAAAATARPALERRSSAPSLPVNPAAATGGVPLARADGELDRDRAPAASNKTGFNVAKSRGMLPTPPVKLSKRNRSLSDGGGIQHHAEAEVMAVVDEGVELQHSDVLPRRLDSSEEEEEDVVVVMDGDGGPLNPAKPWDESGNGTSGGAHPSTPSKQPPAAAAAAAAAVPPAPTVDTSEGEIAPIRDAAGVVTNLVSPAGGPRGTAVYAKSGLKKLSLPGPALKLTANPVHARRLSDPSVPVAPAPALTRVGSNDSTGSNEGVGGAVRRSVVNLAAKLGFTSKTCSAAPAVAATANPLCAASGEEAFAGPNTVRRSGSRVEKEVGEEPERQHRHSCADTATSGSSDQQSESSYL